MYGGFGSECEEAGEVVALGMTFGKFCGEQGAALLYCQSFFFPPLVFVLLQDFPFAIFGSKEREKKG